MKMILLLATLISFNCFAEVTNFKCDFSNESYINQFELEGSVEHENGVFIDADFNFSLRSADGEVKIDTFAVTRSGNVQVFEPGNIYRHKTIRVSSAVKGTELEFMNLLIDFSSLHSSFIRFVNGMTYFSSCKSH